MRIMLLLVLHILALGAVVAADRVVHEYRLDNGLRLVVKEDHRAPVVVSQVWYKVGASYEHGGITGISHVLEHLMFKGTPQHPAGEFSRLIAAHGGQENAFTGRDYTAYFQRLEQSQLAISFALEADRMHNLLLSEEAFATELQVVQEERRLRTTDQPQAFTHEHFNAVAFLHNPLAGGDSARLPRELVRGAHVAAAASADYDLYARLDSLLVVDGIPAQGQSIEALERALREQIGRLREAPVTAEELERIKAQVVASNVYKHDSMFAQAMEIGVLESVGLGWQQVEAYVERVRAVTAAQSQKVARKYLGEDHLTVAILEPLPVAVRHPPSMETAAPPHVEERQHGW